MPSNARAAPQRSLPSHVPPSKNLQHTSSPYAALSQAQYHEISLEVFRRFMTYESSWPADADASVTRTPASPDGMIDTQLPPHTFAHATGLPIADPHRKIRAMPRRSSPTSEPSTPNTTHPSAFSTAPTALPRLVPDDGTASSSTPSHASPQTPERPTSRPTTAPTIAHAPPSAPHSLSRRFEQLSVTSSHDLSSNRLDGTTASAAHIVTQESSDPASGFRFPPLPPKLTDDGYHYRQRAAQFVLLCSQEASPERLSLFNRLSLPHARQSSGQPKVSGLPSAVLDADGASTVGADHVSVHSHHHELDSDDEDDDDIDDDYLDFDACQAAHLGNNKKKRKSSRFSHPGPSGPALLTTSNNSTKQPVSGAAVAESSSTRPVSAIAPPVALSATRDRALADRTNTFAQSEASKWAEDRDRQLDGLVSPGAHESSNAPVLRFAPRQSAGEHRRTVLRSRIRLRLAHAFLRRKLDRLEAEARDQREPPLEAAHTDLATPAPADDAAAQSPERRLPPKRTSKAGKRAQAIRGGSSPAKPLTIAEIRARTAGPASGGAKSLAAPSDAHTSPSRRASSPAAEPKKMPTSEPIRHADAPAKAALASRRSARSSPERTGRPVDRAKTALAPPAAKFEFRIASTVSQRLRELRSQLDAATRNIFDSAEGESRSAVHEPSRTSSAAAAALPVAKAAHASAPRPGGAPPVDDVPPWVRGALASPNATRSPSRVGGAQNGKASQPRAANAVQPGREERNGSASGGTGTKTSSGRRGGARKAVAEPAHAHGYGCRHGHGAKRQPGTGSALFTHDDWICVFCEYELYYGEAPLMLRACRNRKKNVQNKAKAKARVRGAAKSSHAHAAASGHHDHGGHCEYAHQCCDHDHASTTTSDDYHDHHADHTVHNHSAGAHHHGAERDRCDCGNSIHSSDFDDDS